MYRRLFLCALAASPLFGQVDANQAAYFTALGLIKYAPTTGRDALFTGNFSDIQLSVYNLYTSGLLTTPKFSNESGTVLNYFGYTGQNDENSVSKRTFYASQFNGVYNAAGQKFASHHSVTAYGTGDAFAIDAVVTNWGHSVAGGDEGVWGARFAVTQGGTTASTVTASIASTCSTTLTQDVTRITTGGAVAQAVTVASVANCNVGDWMVFGQSSAATNNRADEAVQLTAVGGGALTGVFLRNHANGDSVLPATALTVANPSQFGQWRWVINTSATPYTTGTIASGSSGVYVGSGTTFATNMLSGGTSSNPGCVQADFNTGGGAKVWSAITAVTDTTHISYKLYGAQSSTFSGGSYSIRPCALILNFQMDTSGLIPVISKVILENNPWTWTSGNGIENETAGDYTTGGIEIVMSTASQVANLQAGLKIIQNGTRQIGHGIQITGNDPSASVQAYGDAIRVDAGTAFQPISLIGKSATGLSIKNQLFSGDNKAIFWIGSNVGVPVYTWQDWATGDHVISGSDNTNLSNAYLRFRASDSTIVAKLPVIAPSYHETLTTPSSSSAACSAGDFTDDANFHYVCTAVNTWKRVAVSTW